MPIIFIFLLLFSCSIFPRHITIMLDPAGDTKRAGRLIEDSFERGITMQCAQELKNQLELLGYSIIISRMPGETREPLQTVQFANRLSIDLYIHLDCCATHEEAISLYCYHYSYKESFKQTYDPLNFTPLANAHIRFFDQTTRYAQQFIHYLQANHGHQFHVYGPYQLPISALYGIQVPAFSIECVLPHKNDWKVVSCSIIDAIKKIDL